MAKVLIVGGGFGGVVAAESLARKLEREHQIVLVSRSRKFLFYPALVRLAFGRGEPDDVSFDLCEAMLDRRVTFNEGEIARIGPDKRHVTIARGEFTGQMHYDYLVFALGGDWPRSGLPVSSNMRTTHSTWMELSSSARPCATSSTVKYCSAIARARDFQCRYSKRPSRSRV